MALAKEKMVFGPGTLEWTFITGDGKLNTLKNPPLREYKTTLSVGHERAKILATKIFDFWEANKPKKFDEPNSLGIKFQNKSDGEQVDSDFWKKFCVAYKRRLLDAPFDDEDIKFNLSTRTEFKDSKGNSKPCKIHVKNAKNKTISLSESIGNGSVGNVSAVMAIYETDTTAGVTLYLKAIQLLKFVPYDEDDGFEEQDEETEGLENITTDEESDEYFGEQENGVEEVF